MCCDGWEAREEDTVGECPVCGGPVDGDGDSTEAGCNWSPIVCDECGYRPCDGSC